LLSVILHWVAVEKGDDFTSERGNTV